MPRAIQYSDGTLADSSIVVCAPTRPATSTQKRNKMRAHPAYTHVTHLDPSPATTIVSRCRRKMLRMSKRRHFVSKSGNCWCPTTCEFVLRICRAKRTPTAPADRRISKSRSGIHEERRCPPTPHAPVKNSRSLVIGNHLGPRIRTSSILHSMASTKRVSSELVSLELGSLGLVSLRTVV